MVSTIFLGIFNSLLGARVSQYSQKNIFYRKPRIVTHANPEGQAAGRRIRVRDMVVGIRRHGSPSNGNFAADTFPSHRRYSSAKDEPLLAIAGIRRYRKNPDFRAEALERSVLSGHAADHGSLWSPLRVGQMKI